MGDFNISALLKEAKDRKWDDRTLAQRAADLAQNLHAESIRKLTSDERTLLSALSRLVAEEKNRDFLSKLCDSVLHGSSEEHQCNNLRKLLSEFGGVPTFFGTMARLRFKAASIASRGMQGAALNEVRRIFRTTFGELTLPTQMDKVDKRVRDFGKDKLTLALSPLSPTVFGHKSAERYRRNLEAIQSRQTGVGLCIQPWRLCPGLNLYAPNAGAKELATKLRELIRLSMSGGLSTPIIVETGTSDLLPVVVEGFKQAMHGSEFHKANVIIELPAYLNKAPAILRELTEWATARAAKGAAPTKILIVKGSHLDAERERAFTYGSENAAAATKAQTDTRFKQLVHTAISAKAKSICPVVGTHNPFDITYTLLDWGRCGREGLPHFVFRGGLGNHIGRILTRNGATVTLTAGVAGEDSDNAGFENYLQSLVSELTRPDGFLTYGYTTEPDSMGWTRMRQQFLASLSGREETPDTEDKGVDDFVPGTYGHVTEQAYTHAFFAAADNGREEKPSPIKLILNGKEEPSPLTCIHRSLTAPGFEDYRFTSADFRAMDTAIRHARAAAAACNKSCDEDLRTDLLRIAHGLEEHRAELGALLVRDGGFNYRDAEHELLSAIDACRYYQLSADRDGLRDGTTPTPLGVVVVAPGREHPLADAVAGIAAAWVTGNTIIYKPACNNTLLGYRLTAILRQAGLADPRLQFVPSLDNQIATKLLTSPKVDGVIIANSRARAQEVAEKAPARHLCCQPSGTTSAYLSPAGNWECVVRELPQHVFRRSGQSPTCPHVLLVHAAMYDNQHFINALKDAVGMLKAEPGWREEADIGPLSAALSPEQLHQLTHTEGEEAWLVQPRTAEMGSVIWSPGVRTGVRAGSPLLQHINTLPILALMRVESTTRAISLQRELSAGQAAVIYSHDNAEIETWKKELANCAHLCINCCPSARPGLLPFGSWSPALYGSHALPGGRNFLLPLSKWEETARPQRRGKQRNIAFTPWEVLFPKPNPDDAMRLTTAADSISYWWETEFGTTHTLCPKPGEETVLRYLPIPTCIRVEKETSDIDLSIALMAALKAGATVQLSTATMRPWMDTLSIKITVESRTDYLGRMPSLATDGVHVRDTAATPEDMAVAAACGLHINRDAIIGNGRIEMLHYLREQTITAKN
ncbi:MAG: proline dehydrogenase family protein [Akkermansia sp.]|nr:proline dehydrogenase family protein [Akkermansia sp.]